MGALGVLPDAIWHGDSFPFTIDVRDETEIRVEALDREGLVDKGCQETLQAE